MSYSPVSLDYIDNGDGWELEIRCYREPDHFQPSLRPILMVPGYAMNTFILGYHPTSVSMIEYLTQAGFEVWTSNLRGQGGSRDLGGGRKFGLQHLALVDLPRVLDFLRMRTKSESQLVDAVGCSLGASILYGYLAHHRSEHGLGSMISVGGPLRWNEVHPAMKIAFSSPRIAGSISVRGTRKLAKTFLPIARRIPGLLSIYMNVNICDLRNAEQLVNTVDDPVPHINRQIAHWIQQRDLQMDGLNVTEQLRGLDLPVLCVLANADGIVPPQTALSIRDVLGSRYVSVLEVGDRTNWFAHADLFISDLAEDRVFQPMCDWLLQQQS